MANRKIVEVPVSDIVAAENSRQIYEPREMEELMVSMKQTGLLQPIGVMPLPKAGKYKLIFGFRRFSAATKLGWKVIDCVLVTAKNDEDALIKNSIENVQRANVSFPEQGRIFAGLIKRGLTAGEIAARVGCNKKFVQGTLEAFYKIPKNVQKKIIGGTRGTSKKPGTITPTTAFNALKIKQKYHLTQEQTDKLFEYAATDKAGASQMRVVGALLAKDRPIKEAITQAKSTRIITLQVACYTDVIENLEKKYKMSAHDIAYTWLEQNKELQVIPIRNSHDNKTVVITRKANANASVPQ